MSERLGEPLTRAIDVSPPRLATHYGGSLVLLGFALFVALIGSSMKDHDAMMIFLVIAFLMAIGPVIRLVRRQLMPFEYELHENGVRIVRRGKIEDIAFADIESISIDDRPRDPWGIDRRLTLRASGNTSRFRFIFVDEDPLTDHLFYGFRGTMSGDGWSLDGTTLRSGTRTFDLNTLTRAMLVSREVQAWFGTDETPSFRIPESSPNAIPLLMRLQRSEVPERAATDGFGILLFERGRKRYVAFLALFAAFTFIALPVSMIHSARDLLIGSGFIAAALAIGAWGVKLLTSRVFFHERGIRTKSAFGENAMLYEDVDGVRWQVMSAGVGEPTFALILRGKNNEQLRAAFTLMAIDDDIETLRRDLSQLVMQRILEKLERGERVPWGRFAFRSEGLEVPGTIAAIPYANVLFRNTVNAMSLYDTRTNQRLGHLPPRQENLDAGILTLTWLKKRESS